LDLDGKPIEDAQKDVQIGAIAKIVNTANKTSEEIGTQNGTNAVGEGKDILIPVLTELKSNSQDLNNVISKED
jgi:hypothetical protein